MQTTLGTAASLWFLFATAFAAPAAQAPPASLRGTVTDPSGASVPGARVILTPARGKQLSHTTNERGTYEFRGLAPTLYTLSVDARGFDRYSIENLDLAAPRVLDIQLEIATQADFVDVQAEPGGVTLDPMENAGAIVLRGEDLDMLSDDPDQLAEELQALAGPAAGPNGGQIFIDGFTGGRLPPKSSIREIRINRNPYSAEFDRVGFGRIEIFTRPGTDKFRGDVNFGFSDESLNSRNPFAPNKPPFQSRLFGARLSGPITKKSSFSVDYDNRSVDENEVINATILDESLQPVPFQLAVVTPQRRHNLSTRLDYALNANTTLIGRYSYSPTESENRGVGEFSLPSRAYDVRDDEHSLQLTETSVLNARTLNEIRFQWRRSDVRQLGDNSIPALNVQEAFQDGGPQVGAARDRERQIELQNLTTFTIGTHALKFGGRVRHSDVSDRSPNNFGGTFQFAGGIAPVLDNDNQVVTGPDGSPLREEITSLERYRRTLLLQSLGYSPAAIRLAGGGASQFSINGGDPLAAVEQTDVGLFVTWDWRATQMLTVSGGLRWEDQTNISSHLNFAPRMGIAWALDGGNGKPTKTVLRWGAGIFYDRISDDLTLQAIRFNGSNQVSYIVRNPDFFPEVPSLDTLELFRNTSTLRSLAPDIRTPYDIQTSIGLERSLPANTTVSVNAIISRGVSQLRQRNINAPLPGPGGRPLGDIGNVFQYESTGFNRQNRLMVTFNTRQRGMMLFGHYMLGYMRSDTDGSSPANPYDFSTEYGPSRMDIRHRVVFGGSVPLLWGFSVNPYVIASSGPPFNIVTGRDSNGDSLFLERPAFASDPNAPGVVRTEWGDFLLNPGPNDVMIPRNYGRGPGQFTTNVRLSRTWSFGGTAERTGRGFARGGGDGPRGGGMRGGGMRRGGMRDGGGLGAGVERRRYNLTFSVQARNLFNTVNLGTPVGNLSSPLFGVSTQLAGGGFGPRGGDAGNRRIDLQLRFSF